MELQSNNPTHPHAKLWLAITIVVVVLAAGGVGYYVYKLRKVNNSTISTATTTPAATSQTTTTPAATTKTATATVSQASKDLSAIDVSDISSAVSELKTAAGSFSQ